MHGNVAEWVADQYAPYLAEEATDPWGPWWPAGSSGPSAAGGRVIRGGSFRGDAVSARSAYRFWGHPWNGYEVRGFRVVLPAPS
jgi:formylglycine-generating enzyme required for sulfatase activity